MAARIFDCTISLQKRVWSSKTNSRPRPLYHYNFHFFFQSWISPSSLFPPPQPCYPGYSLHFTMDGPQPPQTAPNVTAAPFLAKIYEMIEDPVTNSIVSWSKNGCSFIVWCPLDFARDLLPQYFKHNNFSSFIRQLNTYGFRKIDPEQWEFANEEFIRGYKHLLKNIHRRKPIHSHSSSQSHGSVQLTDSERQEFEEEIEKLKQDKRLLELELQKELEQRKIYEVEVELVGERLKAIENRQKKMIMVLEQQKKPTKTGNKKRRLLFHGDNGISLSLIDEIELSLKQLEDLVQDDGNGAAVRIVDSSGQNNISSTSSNEIYSSPSLNHEKSPDLSFMNLNIDSEARSSGIHVNLETVRGEIEGGEVNDGFWEQFLT